MKFKITIEELLKALGRTQGVADRKTAMPILANVLIEAAADGIVRFTTFDMEIGISSEHPAEVMNPGSITLNAKMLSALARTIVTPTVEFTLDGTAVDILFGGTHVRLMGESSEQYPRLPIIENVDFCRVSSKQLIDLISKTSFSISKDESRASLHGLLLEAPEKGLMRAVSTDGHRLSLMNRRVEDGELVLENGVILPFKGLGELKKILDESPEAESFIGIDNGSSTLIFKRQGLTMNMRLVDGQFPQYQEVIPSSDVGGVKIRRIELLNALRTMIAIITGKESSVRLTLKEDSLNLSFRGSSCSSDGGIPVEYSGNPVEVGFNALYLKDVLSVIDDDEITIVLMDETSPGVIKACGGDFIAVVMPVRL